MGSLIAFGFRSFAMAAAPAAVGAAAALGLGLGAKAVADNMSKVKKCVKEKAEQSEQG